MAMRWVMARLPQTKRALFAPDAASSMQVQQPRPGTNPAKPFIICPNILAGRSAANEPLQLTKSEAPDAEATKASRVSAPFDARAKGGLGHRSRTPFERSTPTIIV